MTRTPRPYILVIDDEESILEAVHDVLDSEGFEVRSSPRADEVERLYGSSKDLPALILLDVYLRGDNGLEIASRLRSCEHTRNIPIVLMSAQFSNKPPAGVAEALLRKPFSVSELLETIEDYFGPQPQSA